MTRLMALCAGLCLVVPSLSYAADECSACTMRKQGLCAKECEQVPPADAQHCHAKCVAEYCKHKCEASHPDLPKPEIAGCEACLEQQFNLCDSSCDVGSDRKVALCRMDCSEQRCAEACKESEASEKPDAPEAIMEKVK